MNMRLTHEDHQTASQAFGETLYRELWRPLATRSILMDKVEGPDRLVEAGMLQKVFVARDTKTGKIATHTFDGRSSQPYRAPNIESIEEFIAFDARKRSLTPHWARELSPEIHYALTETGAIIATGYYISAMIAEPDAAGLSRKQLENALSYVKAVAQDAPEFDVQALIIAATDIADFA